VPAGAGSFPRCLLHPHCPLHRSTQDKRHLRRQLVPWWNAINLKERACACVDKRHLRRQLVPWNAINLNNRPGVRGQTPSTLSTSSPETPSSSRTGLSVRGQTPSTLSTSFLKRYHPQERAWACVVKRHQPQERAWTCVVKRHPRRQLVPRNAIINEGSLTCVSKWTNRHLQDETALKACFR